MDILNLPHFSLLKNDLVKEIERVWISDQRAIFVTKSEKVYGVGSLPDSVIYTNIFEPRPIPQLHGENVTDVIFAKNYLMALNEEGHVFSWGDNDKGQLGLGTKIKTFAPTRISSLLNKKVIKVAPGYRYAMALCDNGEVFQWGSSISIPRKCDETKKGIDIASANVYFTDYDIYRYTFFIDEDGKVNIQTHDFVTFASHLENIKKLVCGKDYLLALDSNGTIFVRGGNDYGQLGIGNRDKAEKFLTISSIREKVVDIAASPLSFISAAMTESNTIYVWGRCRGHAVTVPYPTSFATFQEVFLNLSDVIMSYGVIHLKKTKQAKNVNVNLLKSINSIFDNPEHSDFTVVVQQKKIHVHKLILITRSVYFKTMFQGSWRENNENVLEIKEYSYDAFRNFLQYLYGLEINVTLQNVNDLMRIADEHLDDALKKLISEEAENDAKISRLLKLLKEITELPSSECEVLWSMKRIKQND